MQPIIATSVAAVTPHDTNPNVYNALWVGGTGNVAVECANGSTATFTAVPAGVVLPVATARVLATGTTATLIVGMKW